MHTPTLSSNHTSSGQLGAASLPPQPRGSFPRRQVPPSLPLPRPPCPAPWLVQKSLPGLPQPQPLSPPSTVASQSPPGHRRAASPRLLSYPSLHNIVEGTAQRSSHHSRWVALPQPWVGLSWGPKRPGFLTRTWQRMRAEPASGPGCSRAVPRGHTARRPQGPRAGRLLECGLWAYTRLHGVVMPVASDVNAAPPGPPHPPLPNPPAPPPTRPALPATRGHSREAGDNSGLSSFGRRTWPPLSQYKGEADRRVQALLAGVSRVPQPALNQPRSPETLSCGGLTLTGPSTRKMGLDHGEPAEERLHMGRGGLLAGGQRHSLWGSLGQQPTHGPPNPVEMELQADALTQQTSPGRRPSQALCPESKHGGWAGPMPAIQSPECTKERLQLLAGRV